MLTQRASPPSMLNRVDPSVFPLSCSWMRPWQNSSVAGQRMRTRALLVTPWDCVRVVGPGAWSSLRWWFLPVGGRGDGWGAGCPRGVAAFWAGPGTVKVLGADVELLLLLGGGGGWG